MSTPTVSDDVLADPGVDRDRLRRFRFKQGLQKEYDTEGQDVDEERKRRRHVRRRHHHGTHKRRKVADEHVPRAPQIPSEDAFRESLFDALADDEGADFWHGVYGQPIHNYSRTYADSETGNIETMTDEQYAQHVRRKMWEKSADGIAAAREVKRQAEKEREERRRAERVPEKDTKTSDNLPYNNFSNFDFELDASLKRGRERKNKQMWQRIWQDYLDRWKALQELRDKVRSSADDSEQVYLRDKLAWPVESGKSKDVTAEEVERFIEKVADACCKAEQDYHAEKYALIKSERVKWHPDKIQQLFGYMNLDQNIMESVTAVFQIFDRLWNELRGRS